MLTSKVLQDTRTVCALASVCKPKVVDALLFDHFVLDLSGPVVEDDRFQRVQLPYLALLKQGSAVGHIDYLCFFDRLLGCWAAELRR